ncbi:7328_t:CDS:2, partial [Paraglomus occultum]
MEMLKEASDTNSKNILQHVLNLQIDFSEALCNATRHTMQSALKRKRNEGEIIIDAGNNPFYVLEPGRDLKNTTNQNGENKKEDTSSVILNSIMDEEIKIEEITMTSAAYSNNSDNELTFGADDLNVFTNRQDDRKWKLGTGRYVEDVLYNLGGECNYHSLVNSFIIDPEDKFVQSGFTMGELREIREAEFMQELPQLDDDLLQYIDTFAK